MFGRFIEAVRGFLGLREAYLGAIDPDEGKWRPLSRGERDLSPVNHERALKLAYYLYETNPIAHRIIEITKDFVVGEGIRFSSPDPEVQRVLNEFWHDPVNLWDLKQHQKALELSLYGEQCYPVFVNPIDGHVRLGYIDPLEIKDVITDPENCEVVREVVLFAGERRLKVIGEDEDSGLLAGECFYFAINKVSNAKRGRSDLLCLIDWIDLYDKFLFSRAERAHLLNAFVWDVTLSGMNEAQIQKWLQANTSPPKPGSIRAHNEKVEWKTVAPNLASHDATHEARLLRNQILGGAGLPEHWFAEGGEVTRATAAEMGEPTIKRLTSRQRYFKHMIEFIFRFVLDQARQAGVLTERNRLEFSITVPEISVRDMTRASASLNQVAQSLALAEDRGWIDKEGAKKLFSLVASHLGVETEM